MRCCSPFAISWACDVANTQKISVNATVSITETSGSFLVASGWCLLLTMRTKRFDKWQNYLKVPLISLGIRKYANV